MFLPIANTVEARLMQILYIVDLAEKKSKLYRSFKKKKSKFFYFHKLPALWNKRTSKSSIAEEREAVFSLISEISLLSLVHVLLSLKIKDSISIFKPSKNQNRKRYYP